MLLFCPSCSNVLTVTSKPPPTTTTTNPHNHADTPTNRLECQTCPYSYPITTRIYERKAFTRKEREDVFGGPDAWKNTQTMDVQCPQDACNGRTAAYYTVQIRSADEPMTCFMKCMECGNQWRD